MYRNINCLYILLFLASSFFTLKAQNGSLKGKIETEQGSLPFANISIQSLSMGTSSDKNGTYLLENIPQGTYMVLVSYTGFTPLKKKVIINTNKETELNFFLTEGTSLDEIVISGTLKPVMRSESPVPVEIYSPAFFKKNPTPNVFEALQNVNGVRPQINCSICNTGDIHINGLEGPYTLVMIDGMPIVSGLSTVYGLSGIPNSLINRVEIVKGPASSLYGSEAVGGLINIITKNPETAPELSTDMFVTGWGETNVDFGIKGKLGTATTTLGANYFFYDQIIDNNNDGFTDLTLQDRVSLFNKWNFKRKSNKAFSIAARFFYEDRWGGENDWNSDFRGSNEIYGESIYTKRYELLGTYGLPFSESVNLSFSYTDHDQNSFYGITDYQAKQRIGFSQLVWDRKVKNHDLLAGTAIRYQYYDDNTPATALQNQNNPEETTIPGVFLQDEITITKNHKLLLGSRLDYDSRHGSIFTPRMAYKWKKNANNIVRLNMGTGFRVVNLFTEDHAALTGSRTVIIEEDLQPEESYNANVNFLKKIYLKSGTFIGLDISAWYTYFTNAIFPDYEANTDEIRYSNLNGFAVSQGVSMNADINFQNGLKLLTGFSLMDVSTTENNIKSRQLLTERFTGNWSMSYTIPSQRFSIDYTGNLFGPMRLPVYGPDDPRQSNSPWFSIQNIQLTYKSQSNLEFYGGLKNILDWTPNRGNPFLLPGADDPFGPEFDTTYIYASNQGIRGFVGMRYTIL